MLQPGRDLDFVQELLLTRIGVGLGHLQRDALLLDRIVRAVDIGKRAGGYAAENPVFSDFLSSF
jgi:hypothetical protein